jgi:hypothetical protein
MHGRLPAFLVLAVAAFAAAQDVIYDSKGFEGFNVGLIDGQDGWHGWEAEGGQGAIVLKGAPAIGERAVRLRIFNAEGAVTEMWREFDDLLPLGYRSVTVAFDIYTPTPNGGWFPVLWWYYAFGGPPGGPPVGGVQWNEEAAGTSHVYPFIDLSDPFTNDPWADAAVDRWATLEITFLPEAGVAIGKYDGAVVSEVDIGGLLSLSVWDMVLSHAGEDTFWEEDIWIDNFIITADKVCYPDFTEDGALDLFDFLAYVNAFNAGEDRADCDADGSLDLFDFLCFVNALNEGC